MRVYKRTVVGGGLVDLLRIRGVHMMPVAKWFGFMLVLMSSVSALPGFGFVFAAQLSSELVSDLAREIAPRSGVVCPDPAAHSLTRRDPAAGPTVVGLGVFFQDIAFLSDVDQTLDTDVYVAMRWRDPRLADATRADGSADCPPPAGRLWMPALEPENLRVRQAFYP